MGMNVEEPKTLTEAVKHFADLNVCHAKMVAIKWPDGAIKCPACGCNRVGFLATRRIYKCKNKDCHKQFSVKVGTIFEDSALGLDKWFVGIWSIINAKNGISSCEIARALGITQKSAWHMLHRVRHALKQQSFDKFTGEIESDESYIGGAASNMHASRRNRKIVARGVAGKDIVHGVLNRSPVKGNSKIRAKVVPDGKRNTLTGQITANVEKGATVYTDTHPSYHKLGAEYVHEMIDHATAYVAGRCHTNGLENFWSLLKRSINGTYVAVDAQHLERYVDEQVFRFNERKNNDGGRFGLALPGVVGKRLMYKELIGTMPLDGDSSSENVGDA
jgi:transposase-like protein